jgi:hypothetical protein
MNSVIREFAKMLETCLAEVQHKRELKLQHPEPLENIINRDDDNIKEEDP